MRNKILPLSLAAVLSWAGSGVCNSSPGTGILEGQVNMVAQGGANLADNGSPREEKTPYGQCPLVVLSKDGRKEIAEVATDKEGRFRVSLPAGDYVLELKPSGRKRLRSTPKQFTVAAQQTVRVELDVESTISPM